MTKPPLFFIHGMWSTPHVWSWFAERYATLGHEVRTPALPFHDAASGAAPAPELGTIGVTDYVDALLAEVAQLPQPPVVIGHSMGGVLAQLVAARVETSGLVLLSPGPTAATVVPALGPLRILSGIVTKWGWWRKPTKVDPAQARWGIFNNVPADVAEREIDALVWDSGRVLFQLGLPWVDGSAATRVDYAKLNRPVLIVVGSEDRITPVAIARATARRLAGRADYRELDGVGHWLFHDPVREQVAKSLDSFLAQLS